MTKEEKDLLGLDEPGEEAGNALAMRLDEEEAEEALTTLVKFSAPYTFEGETYTEIDMPGLEHITAAHVLKVTQMLKKSNSLVPEITLQFACLMAARCSNQPVEFFLRLPAREAMKVKNTVTGFMFGTD